VASWSHVPGLNDPEYVKGLLREYLEDPEHARRTGRLTREATIKTFGIETVGQQWREFLGAP
jgi:hypothetical protein